MSKLKKPKGITVLWTEQEKAQLQRLVEHLQKDTRYGKVTLSGALLFGVDKGLEWFEKQNSASKQEKVA